MYFHFFFSFSFLLLIRIFSRSSGHYYLKSVRNLSECRKNATLNTTVSRYKRSNRNGNSKKSKVIIDSKYSRYCWKLLFQIKTKLGFYAMAFSKEPRSRVAWFYGACFLLSRKVHTYTVYSTYLHVVRRILVSPELGQQWTTSFFAGTWMRECKGVIVGLLISRCVQTHALRLSQRQTSTLYMLLSTLKHVSRNDIVKAGSYSTTIRFIHTLAILSSKARTKFRWKLAVRAYFSLISARQISCEVS